MEVGKQEKRLIIEGNAFYEVDLQCVEQKREQSAREAQRKQGKRQTIKKTPGR